MKGLLENFHVYQWCLKRSHHPNYFVWNLPRLSVIFWNITCLQFLDTCSKHRHPSTSSLTGPYLHLLPAIQIKHKEFEHFTCVKISSITDSGIVWFVIFWPKQQQQQKQLVNCKVNPLISSRLWPLSNIQPYNPPIPLTLDAGPRKSQYFQYFSPCSCLTIRGRLDWGICSLNSKSETQIMSVLCLCSFLLNLEWRPCISGSCQPLQLHLIPPSS